MTFQIKAIFKCHKSVKYTNFLLAHEFFQNAPGPRWGSLWRFPIPPSRLGRGQPSLFSCSTPLAPRSRPPSAPRLVRSRRFRHHDLRAYTAPGFTPDLDRPHFVNPGCAPAYTVRSRDSCTRPRILHHSVYGAEAWTTYRAISTHLIRRHCMLCYRKKASDSTSQTTK